MLHIQKVFFKNNIFTIFIHRFDQFFWAYLYLIPIYLGMFSGAVMYFLESPTFNN